MLREPAANPDYQPSRLVFAEESPKQKAEMQELVWLRALVADYFTIEHEGIPEVHLLSAEDRAIMLQDGSRILSSFTGSLRQEASSAYQELDKALEAKNCFLLFRQNEANSTAPHIIHVLEGRLEKPKAWSVIPNIVLLLLTIFSVLFTGATIAIGEIGLQDPETAAKMGASIYSVLAEIWRGYPYAIAIMLIWGAHEMGHYFMMRYYKAHATLPYFIPAWLISPFGTLGAAIMLREPLKNRKMLLDVGAAGPIAGMIFAIPILLWGLATSPLVPIAPGAVEGNSLLYIFAKLVVFKEILPSATQDVLVNQLAWAGWTGLFITSLNMIPLGQLDGGHVMYALFGNKARLAYIPVLGTLIVITLLFGQTTWLLFFVLLVFLGRFYAVPLEDISPLDNPRRLVAVVALIIFVLTFTPIPLYERLLSDSPAIDGQSAFHFGMMAIATLTLLPRVFRRSQ